ncbi:MAG TPA: hypothetical protein VNY07_13795 [Chthoniobacterales bacterium]|nr:hypothetical protein [Chthoniobacterales bacterium]
MENAIEGDVSTLKSLLSRDDFDKYAKALLTAEGKWAEGQDQSLRFRSLKGRRAPERVIGPLFQTVLFADLRDLLPQDNQKLPDIPKTLKLLEDVRECSQQLIRAARDRLHPKINDLVFENITPLNPDSASVDQYLRPKATPLSDYEWFRFRMVEDSKDADAWTELRRTGLYQHDVSFTLVTTLGDRSIPLPTTIQRNLDAGALPPANADRFLLEIASPPRTGVAIGVFALILFLLVALCICTDIVSDTSGARRPDGIRPYSLARGQMAFWFLVIVGASLFLWIATDAWHILNDTCLWLIGIGSGTALGSAVIAATDSTKAAAGLDYPLTRKRTETFKAFKTRLDKQVQAAGTAPQGETPQATDIRLARRAALAKQQEDVKEMSQFALRRLFHDWLTDGDLYSFHRYQMLAWTLVLGVFFIVKVWSRWELPTFDNTTLALLGITSGTYLGFKLQGAK